MAIVPSGTKKLMVAQTMMRDEGLESLDPSMQPSADPNAAPQQEAPVEEQPVEGQVVVEQVGLIFLKSSDLRLK